MSRRKGTPCACETDPCSCGSSKGKCVRAVNNVSPDPNGDLIIRGGQGIEVIQSGDDLVINNTANPNAFVAGDNIEMTPSGDDIEISLTQDPVINGTLTVNGDIIQNGAAYETHAEKIYTRDDYIIMRDGAIAALAPGDYAGFQVKLYDGVNDGRLVIDNSGTARVGDVGDEEPLLTRDESADLTDTHLLQWDAANFKAVDAGTDVSAINTAIAAKMNNDHVSGYGTVSNGCSLESASNPIVYDRVGRICTVVFAIRLSSSFTGQYTQYAMATGLPPCITGAYPFASIGVSIDGWDNNGGTRAFVDTNGTLTVLVRNQVVASRVVVGSVTYITMN